MNVDMHYQEAPCRSCFVPIRLFLPLYFCTFLPLPIVFYLFTFLPFYPFIAVHSTSTSAFLGSVFTATADRAGKGMLKNSAYTSFIAAKLSMSERKTVVLTTCASLFQDVLSVGERLSGLLLYATLCKHSSCRIDGKLSGDEYHSSCLDGLTVWSDCFRSLFCAYCFHVC